jgi:hypothetical protein
VAFGREWGQLTVYIPAPIPGMMPGFTWVTALIIPYFIIPMDILYTHVLVWVIVGIIIPVIGLQTGFIAWSDQMAVNPDYWFTLGSLYGWRSIANIGCMLGIAVWCIWLLRDRLKTLFGTLKGKDIDEYGLSGRLLAMWSIATFLGLLILGAASNVPILIMFLFLLLYTCWRITGSRIWAEATTMDEHLYATNVHLGTIYPIGVALGWWQHPPPPEGNPSSLLAWNAIANISSGAANARQAFWGGNGLSLYYNALHRAKANFKHIFIGLIISVVIATTIGYITDIWIFMHCGGTAKVNTEAAGPGILTMGKDVLSPDMNVNQSWPMSAVWGTIGFALTIALYLLRTRFAWFFINPLGVLVCLFAPSYAWFNSLLVIVIRLIAVRIFGAKRYTDYIVPIVAGAFAATMALYIYFAIWHFFDTAWPRFTSLYTP